MSNVNSEAAFHAAFWVLFGLMAAMRLCFAVRVRRSGARILPDRAAIRREGWVFAVRLVAALCFMALIVAVCRYRLSLRRFSIPLPDWLRWAGFVLGLAGLVLWTWTHLALGRFWSAQLQLREHHQMITSGPYARVRHPMYLALFAWMAGLVLVISNWVAVLFAAIVPVIILGRLPAEEQMMIERFGDEYRDYMKRTGRFFPKWRASPQPANIGHQA
jgi:protein-S-isoprenylcysteine O-methyltransferase Ste14